MARNTTASLHRKIWISSNMASKSIKGITIEIDGNTSKLQKALSDTNKELKTTQKELKQVDKLLKLDPTNVELLKRKQELLSKSVDDVKKKIDIEKKGLAELSKMDSTPDVISEMQRLKDQITLDEAELSKAEKALDSFGSVGQQQAQAVAKSIQDAGKKVTEFGKKVQDAGKEITTHVTAPIVAAGGAALAAFDEVDKGYDIVIKKTGAAGDAAEEMFDIVDSLATTIPTDFETAGNAVGEVNTRFGVTGAELEELSAQFIKFADLNDTDVATSIDTVQAAMAAFDLSAEDAGDVLDILNKAGQDTGVGLDQLASSLLANGTALQEMGFGINTSIGFLANLEKNGVDTSSVLTGMKKALQNATKDGKSLGEAMDEVQKQMADAATETEAAQAATELFGAKAGPAIAKAVREGRLSFDELSNTVRDWGDSVSSTFDNTIDPIDSWKTTLNQLKITGAELGATIGEVLQPVLQELAQIAADLKAKWDELSPAQQEMIVKIAAIAAMIGPIVAAIGTLITFVGTLITSIGVIGGAMAALAGPIWIAIAAIAAIGVAIAALITHWDEVKAKAEETWENIKASVSQAKEDIVQKWEELKENVRQKIEVLKADLQQKWNAIKQDAVDKVVGMKNDIVNKLTEMKNSIGTKLNEIKSKFTDKFEEIKSKVSGFIEDIKGFFENLKLKIPKPELPKLPHFSLEWGEKTVLGKTISYPKGLNVDWYAKAMGQPYLFTQPTIMQMPYGAIGAGEAGAEIMYGRENLMKDIAQAQAANNEALIEGVYDAMRAALATSDFKIVLNNREVGRVLKEQGAIA